VNTVDGADGFDTALPNVNPVVEVEEPNVNPPELTAPNPPLVLVLVPLVLLLEDSVDVVGKVVVDPNAVPVPNWKVLLPVLDTVPPVPKLKDLAPVPVDVDDEATGVNGFGVSQAAHRLLSLLFVILQTEHFQLSASPTL
jgi:hypothetical protein